MNIKRLFNFIGIIFILGGAAFLMAPTAINSYSTARTDQLIADFNSAVERETSAGGNGILDKLKADIADYNTALITNGQDIKDPFFYEGESLDLTRYGFEDNMFGYIEIPKLKLSLGIFMGATEGNMTKGAVHLDKTSIPVGGESTNSVIAAHRGAGRYGDMFRNIQRLEEGDSVFIVNPWERLEYRVTEIFTIEPDDIDKILIQEGKDMLTLVSCHPYGSSRYRYIVYCEREADANE